MNLNVLKTKKRFQYLIILLLIILFLLELSLRLSGKLETYSEKNFGYYLNHYDPPISLFKQNLGESNSTFQAPQKEFDFIYPLDSLGLIGNTKNDNCLSKQKIFFLGDSFIFGIGAEKADNLVSQLQNKDTFNCYYNAGIPGSDPFFEEQLIRTKFLMEKYRGFVIAINPSDLMDYVFRGGKERFESMNSSTQEPWFHPFYEYSHIVRAFVHGVLKRDYSLLSQKELIQRKEEAVKAYLELLMELNTEIKEKFNGNFLVITHPYPTNFQHKKSSLEKEVFNYSYLEDLCGQLNDNGVCCADLYPDFTEVLTEYNYLAYSWPIDGHFNAKGYKLYADILWNSPKFKQFLQSVKNKKERQSK